MDHTLDLIEDMIAGASVASGNAVWTDILAQRRDCLIRGEEPRVMELGPVAWRALNRYLGKNYPEMVGHAVDTIMGCTIRLVRDEVCTVLPRDRPTWEPK